MNRVLANPWLLLGVRIVIGLAFAYAGATKLMASDQFADSIASFQILPNTLINILALGLPPTEILAGLMMISGWHYRSANFCILVLSVIFALALGQALARGLQVDCGCFGSGKPSTAKTWLSLGRDILVLFGCLLVHAGSLGTKDDGESGLMSGDSSGHNIKTACPEAEA
jgi:uncharacterized membrane protein YphA (DoxX/SURF4 family)